MYPQSSPRGGCGGAVLVCQSDSQQIVAMQHIIMCICVCVCMCTMCKCSTCSFSMQLCNGRLCMSQSVKHAALYFSHAKICSRCFHVWSIYYVFCGWLITHLSASQMVGLALDYHVPAEPLSFHRGNLITSYTLELGHPHHRIYTDFI